MKKIILRIFVAFVASTFFSCYSIYKSLHLTISKYNHIDIVAILIFAILNVILFCWDGNGWHNFKKGEAREILLIAYSICVCRWLWLCSLEKNDAGLVAMFVLLSLISPLTLIGLDWYNNYSICKIIKRALVGIIVNVGWISFFMTLIHSPLLGLFLLAPIVSAIISDFVSRKKVDKIN